MSRYSDEELDKIMSSFAAIPLHQSLGLAFERRAEGPAVTFAVTRELAGGFDYLHGGVLYVALDVASAYALVPVLPKGVQEKTVDISVSMIRSARVGDTVELTARVDHVGRSNAFLAAFARRSSDGQLIARAQITKAFTPLDKLAAADALARGEMIRS